MAPFAVAICETKAAKVEGTVISPALISLHRTMSRASTRLHERLALAPRSRPPLGGGASDQDGEQTNSTGYEQAPGVTGQSAVHGLSFLFLAFYFILPDSMDQGLSGPTHGEDRGASAPMGGHVQPDEAFSRARGPSERTLSVEKRLVQAGDV